VKQEGKAASKACAAPFKQDSKEFKFLIKLFQDGKISSIEQLASVHSKYLEHAFWEVYCYSVLLPVQQSQGFCQSQL
jgi:hypothetical protein